MSSDWERGYLHGYRDGAVTRNTVVFALIVIAVVCLWVGTAG